MESPVTDFYRGRSIFITGGTGFVGRALVEKLLRSCPELDTVFLLVREKRGTAPADRIASIFSGEIFSRVLQEQPGCLDKVVAIPGDLTSPDLGMSAEHRQLLQQRASLVVHCGATVKFTDTLRVATQINVTGTTSLLDFCTTLTHLQALLYVSTAYSQFTAELPILEKVYEVPVDPRRLVQCAEWMTDEQLACIAPSICHGWSNPYAFTKACSEKLVDSYKDKLPVVIFRPSLVLGSYEEPVAGYVDSYVGCSGIIVGAAAGVLRVSLMVGEAPSEVVPLDITVNAIIAAVWRTATQRMAGGETPVYNMVSSSRNPITWNQLNTEMTKIFAQETALEGTLWYPFLMFVTSRKLFQLLHFFLHFLPAVLMDSVGAMLGKTRRLVKIYERTYKHILSTESYALREWRLDDSKMAALSASLTPHDRQLFPCDIADMQWSRMTRVYAHGLRKYLLKQQPDTIRQARSRWFKLRVVHYIVMALLSVLLLRVLYACCCGLMSAHDYVTSHILVN